MLQGNRSTNGKNGGNRFMTTANVLLVDDERLFLERMTKLLKHTGMETITAGNGRSALEKLAGNHPIDVVVLDDKMPEMSGFEALKEIRWRHPMVEVIMLSGSASFEKAIAGLKQGACDYLMKPCHFDYLVTKIREAASRKKQHENKIFEARMKKIPE